MESRNSETEGKEREWTQAESKIEQRFEWLKQTTEQEGAGGRTRDSDGEGKNEKALPSGSSPPKETWSEWECPGILRSLGTRGLDH